jgi:hypothetical protein
LRSAATGKSFSSGSGIQGHCKAVPGERFELPTNGLQNRCSTTELTRQAVESVANFCSHVGLLPLFATALLPNVFRAAVYGSAQRIVNAGDCVFLHPRKNVAVEIKRDPDFAMA